MKSKLSYSDHNNKALTAYHPAISSQQFESLREQVRLLNPQQLKVLQGEINSSLKIESVGILTNEELDAISALFS